MAEIYFLKMRSIIWGKLYNIKPFNHALLWQMLGTQIQTKYILCLWYHNWDKKKKKADTSTSLIAYILNLHPEHFFHVLV